MTINKQPRICATRPRKDSRVKTPRKPLWAGITAAALGFSLMAVTATQAQAQPSESYVAITSSGAPETKFRGIVHTGKKPNKKSRIGVASCDRFLCQVTAAKSDPASVTTRLFVTPVTKKGVAKMVRYRVEAVTSPDEAAASPTLPWNSGTTPSPSVRPGISGLQPSKDFTLVVGDLEIPYPEIPYCPDDHYDDDVFNDSPVYWQAIQIMACRIPEGSNR